MIAYLLCSSLPVHYKYFESKIKNKPDGTVPSKSQIYQCDVVPSWWLLSQFMWVWDWLKCNFISEIHSIPLCFNFVQMQGTLRLNDCFLVPRCNVGRQVFRKTEMQRLLVISLSRPFRLLQIYCDYKQQRTTYVEPKLVISIQQPEGLLADAILAW